MTTNVSLGERSVTEGGDLERAPHDGAEHRTRLRQLSASRRQLSSYQVEIALRAALSFGLMLASVHGLLPVWALVITNVVLYPPIYLRVHDLGHALAPNQLGWIARFVPTANPIWGGTRVFAHIHHQHHLYLGTDRDPWLPYYAGHPLRALFFNFIELEYTLVQFVRQRGIRGRGIDAELLANIAFNVACLTLGLWLFHWVYLAHVVSQRVVHTIGIYFFNFYTHRATFSKDAPIGAWPRDEQLSHALPLLRVVWGADTLDGLVYHSRHHCIGQSHVPVANYKHLIDTGRWSHLNRDWPLSRIKKL